MDHDGYANPSMLAENESPTAREFEDESFDYKLIKKVEIYTFLYNNRKKQPEKATAAWQEISKSLCKTVEECQKRWIRLRQYYSKERQKRESGILAYKWPLYDAMAFLLPFIKKKKTVFQNHKESASSPGLESQESSEVNTQSEPRSIINSDKFDEYEDVEYDSNFEQIVEEQSLPTTTSGTNVASATTVVPADTVVSVAAIVPGDLSPIADCLHDAVVYKSPAHRDNSDIPESPTRTSNIPSLTNTATTKAGSHKKSKKKNDPKVNNEEKKIIAELIHKRLQKCKDISKRNNLILKIMDIIFN